MDKAKKKRKVKLNVVGKTTVAELKAKEKAKKKLKKAEVAKPKKKKMKFNVLPKLPPISEIIKARPSLINNSIKELLEGPYNYLDIPSNFMVMGPNPIKDGVLTKEQAFELERLNKYDDKSIEYKRLMRLLRKNLREKEAKELAELYEDWIKEEKPKSSSNAKEVAKQFNKWLKINN